jgi:hypothetical protein
LHQYPFQVLFLFNIIVLVCEERKHFFSFSEVSVNVVIALEANICQSQSLEIEGEGNNESF